MTRRQRRNRRGQYAPGLLRRGNQALWNANKKTARFIFWRVFF